MVHDFDKISLIQKTIKEGTHLMFALLAMRYIHMKTSEVLADFYGNGG